MKLLYCGYCGDIVRLFQERRACRCGKSWGQYLMDGATTVQTPHSASLGLMNADFRTAMQTYKAQPEEQAPTLVMRLWINPLSEPDVQFYDEHLPKKRGEPMSFSYSGTGHVEPGQEELRISGSAWYTTAAGHALNQSFSGELAAVLDEQEAWIKEQATRDREPVAQLSAPDQEAGAEETETAGEERTATASAESEAADAAPEASETSE